MPVLSLDHVQLAMPAGREEEALESHYRVFVDDPFGKRLELMEPWRPGR